MKKSKRDIAEGHTYPNQHFSRSSRSGLELCGTYIFNENLVLQKGHCSGLNGSSGLLGFFISCFHNALTRKKQRSDDWLQTRGLDFWLSVIPLHEHQVSSPCPSGHYQTLTTHLEHVSRLASYLERRDERGWGWGGGEGKTPTNIIIKASIFPLSL